MKSVRTKNFRLAVYAKGDKDANRLALVLPGRLDSKDYAHMHSHVKFLASKGYFALSFDPPGTWESPGGIGLYTMTNYLKAINELIEYFGNKPTFAMGHSRGGSMAMLAATSNPNITGFVSIMSRASASSPSRSTKPGEISISYRDLPEDPNKKRKFDFPYEYFTDSQQYNIIESLKHYGKPKMFVYGTRDGIVNPKYVKEAYEASIPPKVLKSVNSDHDYRWSKDVISQVNELIGSFLDKYLSERKLRLQA